MASNYDSTDLSWSWKGDYSVGEDGDLAHNANDFLESIENEIVTVIKSSSNDWSIHPQIGANLWRFGGEPNTRRNAARIKDAIEVALISAGLVSKGDVQVEVNALDLHSIYIKIFLNAISTPYNRISSQAKKHLQRQYNQGIEIKLLFDTNTSAIYY